MKIISAKKSDYKELKNLRPLSIWEWLVCATGMFFMGLGMGYIDVQVFDYGIGFFLFGLILETPAFYLVFKHKRGQNLARS